MEKSKMALNMRRSRFLLLAAAAAAGVVVAGCGRKPAAGDSAGGPPGASGAGGPAAVSTATAVTVSSASRKDIDKTLDVTGSLVALQDVVVGAKAAGKLASVSVHEGDTVTAGQVVAVMDPSDYQAQVQQSQAALQASLTKEEQAAAALAQARTAVSSAQTTLSWTDRTTKTAVQLAQNAVDTAQQRLLVVQQGARQQERQQSQEAVIAAQASYDKAKSDLRRYQDLFRQQAVPATQLDQMQASFDTAQANLNSAKQAYSLIQEGSRPEDIQTAKLAVQQAQDSLAKAQADRATVQLRREDLATARVAVKSAEAGVDAARAGTAQSRASLRLAQDALENAYVRSPISGIVAERRAEPGQQLGSGGAILRIVAPRSVYFQAVLSESQYAEIRYGQEATVTVDAIPGASFKGSVTRILPVASASARSFTVRIDFPPDNRLRPQMFARGSILISRHRDAVVVDKSAVIFDPESQEARLFVASADGTAEQRSVKVGYINTHVVEILSGVKPGDKIITTGQSTLQDGDKIRIQ